MNYEWGDTLFRTKTAMLDAIAAAWVTARGHASPDETRRNFDESTDAELAAAAIDGWGLDQPRGRRFSLDDERPSHMAEYGYSVEDLTAAFARVRALYERHAQQAE